MRGVKNKFRVGTFPEHEIAEAAVATGANQQIHVEGRTVRVGDFAEALGKFTLRDFEAGEHPASGAKDGVTRGVVHSDAQFQGASGGGEPFGGFDRLRESRGNAVATANDAQADSGSGTGGSFGAKILFEKREQGHDFAHGAFPVVRGERVKRHGADAQAGSGADDAADGFHAGAMPFGACQAAARKPSGHCRRGGWRRGAWVELLTSKYFYS